jgi:hypothetical protein
MAGFALRRDLDRAGAIQAGPSGLIIDQTFRYWSYDPTNHGWAGSYPQLLVGRNPEIGGASNLDIRKYRDLTRFRYQSRIIRVTPVGTRTLR